MRGNFIVLEGTDRAILGEDRTLWDKRCFSHPPHSGHVHRDMSTTKTNARDRDQFTHSAELIEILQALGSLHLESSVKPQNPLHVRSSTDQARVFETAKMVENLIHKIEAAKASLHSLPGIDLSREQQERLSERYSLIITNQRQQLKRYLDLPVFGNLAGMEDNYKNTIGSHQGTFSS
ncbi:hypothetical protein BJ742DRAFT_21896 [Cladochytrium replicatum]|nr:hypothetical protein BJ742DRAFT_21896 [Cladochytrium replicatum]